MQLLLFFRKSRHFQFLRLPRVVALGRAMKKN
jgi:hypothetical protein